ncbi:MAG: hypothetical protein R6U95_01805 [Bacteroidales bacterium]
MRIAVDFDGTVVEHKYPHIGEVKLFAFETLRELQKQGHLLILWTYRWGKELDEAVEFCARNGVEFYAVNKNYPEEIYDEKEMSRKIDCDVYIDDRNLGGFVEWTDVWKIINGDNPFMDDISVLKKEKRKKKSFFKRIFS